MLKRLLLAAVVALLSVPALAAGPIWVDRVQDTSLTAGTSDFVLLNTPPTGLQAWSTVGNSNTAQYVATDTAGDWEQGLGTYSSVGPTLARTTVYASSNSGSKVSFTGTVTISLTPDSVWFAAPLPAATTCTNQFISAISTAGAGTCATVANTALANSSMTLAGHSVSLGGTQTFACADLSNGATGCSTATGTSGGTIPLLNGANTWSGVQSFNDGDVALKGATSGSATLKAPATGGGNLQFHTAGTVLNADSTDTVTNKTISGSSNTLSNIGNSSLTNSSMNIAGHSISLGGTQAIACGDLSDAAATCSSASAGTETWTRINGGSISSGTGIALGATYKRLKIVFKEVTTGSVGHVTLALSSNGGSSYGTANTIGTDVGGSSSSSGTVEVLNAGLASTSKYISGLSAIGNGSAAQDNVGVLLDFTEATQNDVTDHIKFVLSNATGTYVLWGEQ